MVRQVWGEISTTLSLPDGTLIDREVKKNNILNAGLLDVVKIILGQSTSKYTYVQVGTGGETLNTQLYDAETGNALYDPEGDPILGDVLKTVANNETALYTFYRETNSILQDISNGRYTISASLQIPIDIPVNEAGICNGPQAGSPTMIAKQVFSNTVKRWQSRQRATLSVVDTDYVILQIAWAIYFGRDPDLEVLYDQDIAAVFNSVTYRSKV